MVVRGGVFGLFNFLSVGNEAADQTGRHAARPQIRGITPSPPTYECERLFAYSMRRSIVNYFLHSPIDLLNQLCVRFIHSLPFESIHPLGIYVPLHTLPSRFTGQDMLEKLRFAVERTLSSSNEVEAFSSSNPFSTSSMIIPRGSLLSSRSTIGGMLS